MENHNPQERSAPIQFMPRSRAFRQFKNPPQPHMCIQDAIKDSSEKLYINVLGWQKIANPKQYSDPIPLYGGMQVGKTLLFTYSLFYFYLRAEIFDYTTLTGTARLCPKYQPPTAAGICRNGQPGHIEGQWEECCQSHCE